MSLSRNRKTGIVKPTINKGRPKNLIVVDLPPKKRPQPDNPKNDPEKPKTSRRRASKKKTDAKIGYCLAAPIQKLHRVLSSPASYCVVKQHIDDIDLAWFKTSQGRMNPLIRLIIIDRPDSPCPPNNPLMIRKINRAGQLSFPEDRQLAAKLTQETIEYFGSRSLYDYYAAMPQRNLELRMRRAMRLLIEHDYIPLDIIAEAIDEKNLSALYQALKHKNRVSFHIDSGRKYGKLIDRDEARATFNLDVILPPAISEFTVPNSKKPLTKVKPKKTVSQQGFWVKEITIILMKELLQNGEICLRDYPECTDTLRNYSSKPITVQGKQGIITEKERRRINRTHCPSCNSKLKQSATLPSRQCTTCRSRHTMPYGSKYKCENCQTVFNPSNEYRPKKKCQKCKKSVESTEIRTFYRLTDFGRCIVPEYFNIEREC